MHSIDGSVADANEEASIWPTLLPEITSIVDRTIMQRQNVLYEQNGQILETQHAIMSRLANLENLITTKARIKTTSDASKKEDAEAEASE